jgi:hypothetical protein
MLSAAISTVNAVSTLSADRNINQAFIYNYWGACMPLFGTPSKVMAVNRGESGTSDPGDVGVFRAH